MNGIAPNLTKLRALPEQQRKEVILGDLLGSDGVPAPERTGGLINCQFDIRSRQRIRQIVVRGVTLFLELPDLRRQVFESLPDSG